LIARHGSGGAGPSFRKVGELPIGDVMLTQKIVLESCALVAARRFEPNGFMFRRARLLGCQ
jgi:hypothetical protein